MAEAKKNQKATKAKADDAEEAVAAAPGEDAIVNEQGDAIGSGEDQMADEKPEEEKPAKRKPGPKPGSKRGQIDQTEMVGYQPNEDTESRLDDSGQPTKQRREEGWKARTVTEPKDGTIIEEGDPLEIEGEEVNGQVIVKKTVYRRVFAGRSKTPSFVILAVSGSLMPAGSVQRKKDGKAKGDEDN
jgi:hypothetical protein